MTTPQPRSIQQGNGYMYHLKQRIIQESGPIFQVRGFQGGWERWMQIEFARTIRSEYHREVLCEQYVWGDGRKIDLWAESYSDQGVPRVGIELKCRTALEQNLEFADRFHADVVKTVHRPVHTPCLLYAVGLTTEFADCAIQYNPVTIPNTDGQTMAIHYEQVVQGLYLLWSAIWYT